MILGQVVVWMRSDTKEELAALKQKGETYDELLKKMIEVYKKTLDKPTSKNPTQK